MLRLVLLAFCCAAALIVSAGPASAGSFTRVNGTVAMDDGVPLATTLYTPVGTPPAGGWPSIMLFGQLGEAREPLNLMAETYLATEGYAVLTFDPRGTGESGGLVSLDGQREIQDVRTLFDWLAARHGLARTRIGAMGFFYGGGTVWRAAAAGVRFAAIVPIAAWTDFYGALAPQNLFKDGAFQSLLAPVPTTRQTDLLRTSAAGISAGDDVPAIRTLAGGSSLAGIVGLKTPTFMIQGRRDFAVGMEQATDAYVRLRGPKRLYIGDLGHDPSTNPPAERGYYLAEARLWFDRYLKGIPNGIEYSQPIELAPDTWTGHTAKFWKFPARRSLTLPLAGTSTIAATGKVVRAVRKPLARDVEEFGAPLARVTVSSTTGWPHLVAVLTATTPRGDRIVVSDGGIESPIGAASRTFTIRLVNDATLIPRGSRLQLTLAATSTAQSADNTLYEAGVPADAQLTVGRVVLTIPTLRKPVSQVRSR